MISGTTVENALECNVLAQWGAHTSDLGDAPLLADIAPTNRYALTEERE